ncbi:MAG: 2'-5' RNA ligase family protein [Cyclobacteriaceae bacterium]|nr:2'-5' RNA ligase family protein [Cyclobacteriaceae bacterium]
MEKFCVNRFFFTITPSQPVQIFVSDLKKHVREVLGHGFQDELYPAYIPLFKYTDFKTESFLYDADWLTSALLPFEIHVNGLGAFKHGGNKTIYLHLEYKTPNSELANALGGEPITPHIIIARNLESDDFTKAWEHLQNVPHYNYFRCTTVTVLKKEPNRWNRSLELPLDKSDQPFEADTLICSH